MTGSAPQGKGNGVLGRDIPAVSKNRNHTLNRSSFRDFDSSLNSTTNVAFWGSLRNLFQELRNVRYSGIPCSSSVDTIEVAIIVSSVKLHGGSGSDLW